MSGTVGFVSPKQVARALGVSESSMKRWCDQGLIPTSFTAGGHRKIATADALQFARDHGHALVSPEVLGLPVVSEQSELGLTRSVPRLVDALLAGKDELARQIVFDLYLAKNSVDVICDEVIARAFRLIGDRWACHSADVYQERRGCEIAMRLLSDVRRVLSQPSHDWTAIGGTIEGDYYSLPSTMAELVLRESGIHATALGNSIPFRSLIQAVRENRPSMFWLSVSHIREGLDFAVEFAALSQTCQESGTALVVGGRALTSELRQKLNYSAFCDTMQHLASFAKTLVNSSRSKEKTASLKQKSNRQAAAKKSPTRG